MLGNSFLYGVARAARARFVRTCADGVWRAARPDLGGPGAHRRLVSKAHLLSLCAKWRPAPPWCVHGWLDPTVVRVHPDVPL